MSNYLDYHNILYIDSNGKVGVNNNTPVATLNLTSGLTSANGHDMIRMDSPDPTILFNDTTNTGTMRIRWQASTGTGNGLRFYRDDDGADPQLMIDLNGNVLVGNGNIQSRQQIRATGWWNSTGGAFDSAAAEIGVSGGMAYLMHYNRSNSSYGPVQIQGSTVNLNPTTGAATYENSEILSVGNSANLIGVAPLTSDNRMKQFVLNPINANGTQAREAMIARLSIDTNDWSSISTMEIELAEQYYYGSRRKRYVVVFNPYNSGGGENSEQCQLWLMENEGTGRNDYDLRASVYNVGGQQSDGGYTRYADIYCRADHYSRVSVTIRYNGNYTTSTNVPISHAWINTGSPSYTNIASFTADTDSSVYNKAYVHKTGGTFTGAITVQGNTTVGGNLTIDGNYRMIGGIGARTTGGTLNWNDISNARSGSGYTLLTGNASNGPVSNGHFFHPFTFEYAQNNGNNNMTQFAIPYQANQPYGPYFRSRYGGTWTGWYEMWHSGNDGSGSGLDADKVDGLQASSFLRSDAGDSASGSINFTNSYYAFGNSTGSVSNDSNWTARLNLAGSQHARLDVKSVSDGIITTMYSHSGHAAGRIGTMSNHKLNFLVGGDIHATLSTGGSLSTSAQGTLWGSSNDGSGSGLDADMVDGLHESSFMRRTANSHLNMNNYNINNVNSLTFQDPGAGEGIHWASGNGWSIYESPDDLTSNTSGNLQFVQGSTREMTLNTSGSLYTAAQGTLWGSSNDGSGSGLDADKVDGLQASSFLRSDAGDTVSGNLTYATNLRRNAHHKGHFEGGHNNIGTSSAKTSPIYTIGSSYNPNDSTLGNMYGIGFCASGSATFIPATLKNGSDGWGLYVAADGDARIFLNSSAGTIQSTGAHYAGGYRCLTTNDEGSGKGIDADTVDGVHLSSLVRHDTDLTVSKSGTWNINNNGSDWAIRVGNTNGSNSYVYMCDDTSGMHIRNDSSTTSNYLLDVYAANGNRFRVRGADAHTTINGNAVFHDGYHPNADKWTTARTLALSGDATGSISLDGSADKTMGVTVANNSHTHTISNITNLQTALDGKAASSHSHTNYLTSNANDTTTGLLTINRNSNEQLKLATQSTTGSPYISFYQGTSRSAYIQFNDSNNNLILYNDVYDDSFQIGSGDYGLTHISNGNTRVVLTDEITDTQVTKHGDWYAAYSNTDTYSLSYDHNTKLSRLYSPGDTTIGAIHKATCNKNGTTTYKITIRAKCNVSMSSGFYIGVHEYDYDLPDGKIAISNSASTSESVVQEDTRLTWLRSNGSISINLTEYTFTHTVASTCKWFSVGFLNWSGMSTYALFFDPDIRIERVPTGLIYDDVEMIRATTGGVAINGGSNMEGGQINIKYDSNSHHVAVDVYHDTGHAYSGTGGAVNDAYWRVFDDTLDSGDLNQMMFNVNSGDLEVSGDMVSFGFSDKRLKDNLKIIEDPVDKLKQLNGYTFTWNEQSTKQTGMQDIGVIAQEIQAVFPELVKEKDNGHLGVRYDKLTAVLIAGMNEQQQYIEQQQEQINRLTDKLEQLIEQLNK